MFNTVASKMSRNCPNLSKSTFLETTKKRDKKSSSRVLVMDPIAIAIVKKNPACSSTSPTNGRKDLDVGLRLSAAFGTLPPRGQPGPAAP